MPPRCPSTSRVPSPALTTHRRHAHESLSQATPWAGSPQLERPDRLRPTRRPGRHYRDHPDARPDLAEIALAAAEIDGSPLAATPDLVRRAAAEVGSVKDDPGPDDVLLYAAGLAAAAA